MNLSDCVILIVVAIAAWSQYRCHLLQEKLSRCLKGETSRTGEGSGSKIQKMESDDDGEARPRVVDRKMVEGGSSVWCWGSSNTDRTCRFHNLCFSRRHEEFIFLSGPQSISFGVPANPFDPALVDLSSVRNHNTQYFGYSHLPVAALEDIETVAVFSGKYLLMNRFNPGNVMHVFHDDLLPVFYTLLQNGLMNKEDYRPVAKLVFMDGYPSDEFMDLYVSLFHHKPILRDDLIGDFAGRAKDSLVCFQEAHVGLTNATTWYQYGFEEPQGPIPETLVTAQKLRLFTSFVQNKIGLRKCEESDDYALLVRRESTRLILNEMELVLQVAQSTGMRVITAGLDDFSLKDLMEQVSCAKVLIGMHGSLLILSMFLPEGSMLLEMFPYAINPDHYTPYMTLAELSGMGITYRLWKNMNPDHSVAHPDALPAYGGISHLSLEEQRRILSSTEVPRHLCCSNPDWLYRIYQDTIVDVPSVLHLLSNGLADCKRRTANVNPPPVFPSKVGNINCRREKLMHLSWQPPWNIEYVNTNEVQYELWIQEKDKDDYEAYIVQLSEYTVSESLEETKTYRVWIRCLVGNIKGPFTTVVC